LIDEWQGYPLKTSSFNSYLPKNSFEEGAKIEENSRNVEGNIFCFKENETKDKTGRIW
jgi:hypothetical protein